MYPLQRPVVKGAFGYFFHNFKVFSQCSDYWRICISCIISNCFFQLVQNLHTFSWIIKYVIRGDALKYLFKNLEILENFFFRVNWYAQNLVEKYFSQKLSFSCKICHWKILQWSILFWDFIFFHCLSGFGITLNVYNSLIIVSYIIKFEVFFYCCCSTVVSISPHYSPLQPQPPLPSSILPTLWLCPWVL